jgi:mono/diheme cytochrome c family protein
MAPHFRIARIGCPEVIWTSGPLEPLPAWRKGATHHPMSGRRRIPTLTFPLPKTCNRPVNRPALHDAHPCGRLIHPGSLPIVAIALVLLVASCGTAAATPADTGSQIFLLECAACHGKEALGDGPDAHAFASPVPNLRSGLLDSHSDSELSARLLNGRLLRIEKQPGSWSQHAASTEEVYRFLRRLPSVDWGRADAGLEVYLARCLDCHDRYGHPAHPLPASIHHPPVDLAAAAFQKQTDNAELRLLCRHGKQRMPALVPQLTKEEADQVVAYVRLLSAGYELYDRHCRVCHGDHGEGAAGQLAQFGMPQFAFDAAYFERRSPEEIHQQVWHMLRTAQAKMPHFRSTLTEEDLVKVFGFLRSLPKGSPTPQ